MTENPDLQVELRAPYLSGRKVALCVTGGIAAIETPQLARQLRRFGAEVQAYATPQALQFIGQAALEWATAQPVIQDLSGLAEHICQADLVVVAPATLNTINKIFAGLADDAVTTLIASALGQQIPLLLVPAMHASLWRNPVLQQNLARAQAWGMTILSPRWEEGKAKIPDRDTIVAAACRLASRDPLRGKRLMVTGGPTPGKIDSIRLLTNRFRGTLARALALEAYHRGADVKLLLGNPELPVPGFLDTERPGDFFAYREQVLRELATGYDCAIFSAAVADFIPQETHAGKIPSGAPWRQIPLQATTKVIREVRQKFPQLVMVTFKYEDNVTREELLEIARQRIAEGYQWVVANRGEDMQQEHRAYILNAAGIAAEAHSKDEIARLLMDLLGGALG